MSEHSPRRPEQNNQNAELASNKEVSLLKEKLIREAREKAEKAGEQTGSTEHLVQRVQEKALSSSEIPHMEKVASNTHHPVLINKQLKDMAYSRSILRVRKQLGVGSRTFSKVVHNKAVEKTSEALGKTVARPSGLLGGAMFSAIGSLILLWTVRHYGYEYNYLMAILLFAGGLGAGLLTEFGLKAMRKNK